MKTVRIIAIVALALLSIGAIMGAVLLIQNPTGSPMQISPTVLQHSGFHSFLIPGILLLLSQGLLPLMVMVVAIFCKRGYGWWIGFQGCVLFGWISIEVILLRTVVWLHYVYWGLALLLMACGWALHKQDKTAPAPMVLTPDH